MAGQQDIYNTIELGCHDILILLPNISPIQTVDRLLLQIYNTDLTVIQFSQRNTQLQKDIWLADSHLITRMHGN